MSFLHVPPLEAGMAFTLEKTKPHVAGFSPTRYFLYISLQFPFRKGLSIEENSVEDGGGEFRREEVISFVWG